LTASLLVPILARERDKAMIDSGAMPAKKKASKPEQDAYSVGDRLQVRLSAGRIVEATVKAVVTKTGGVRLQVSFGNETALVYLWQVVEKLEL